MTERIMSKSFLPEVQCFSQVEQSLLFPRLHPFQWGFPVNEGRNPSERPHHARIVDSKKMVHYSN